RDPAAALQCDSPPNFLAILHRHRYLALPGAGSVCPARYRATRRSGQQLRSAESNRFANPRHHLVRNFVCALSTLDEDFVDISFVAQDFLATLAHRREIFPEFFE